MVGVICLFKTIIVDKYTLNKIPEFLNGVNELGSNYAPPLRWISFPYDWRITSLTRVTDGWPIPDLNFSNIAFQFKFTFLRMYDCDASQLPIDIKKKRYTRTLEQVPHHFSIRRPQTHMQTNSSKTHQTTDNELVTHCLNCTNTKR